MALTSCLDDVRHDLAVSNRARGPSAHAVAPVVGAPAATARWHPLRSYIPLQWPWPWPAYPIPSRTLAHAQTRSRTHNAHPPPGYLILYYAGVLKVLQQLGIYQPGRAAPPVAGASSGALTSAAVCSGVQADRFYETVGAPGACVSLWLQLLWQLKLRPASWERLNR
jgi:hypothetical protein